MCRDCIRRAADARSDGAGTRAQQPSDATAIIRGAIDHWRGTSSYALVAMTVHRPAFERTSVMRIWTRGEKDALVRFVEPARSADDATLKRGDDMWVFTPRLNRVVKIPFSMMAASWMGSDGVDGADGALGLGLSFALQELAGDSTITLPAENASVIVLATSGAPPVTVVTLPPAADGVSRMVLVRRMDARGRLIVRAPGGPVLGGPAPDGVVLERRFDQVVLVSDGANWVIFDSNTLGGGAQNK